MIKISVIFVCVCISYAEPQRQNVYLPIPFNRYEDTGPYHYVRAMEPMQQPFVRPINRIPIMTANRFPTASYPTFIRLPALPNRRQFRLPQGGYFIVPASAFYGHQQSSIQEAQRFFQPVGPPTAPQERPAIAATQENDECQEDASSDHQSTEEIKVKKID